MSAGLERIRRLLGRLGIRQAMADYLNGKGVRAITAWPDAPRAEGEEPVVVVSLRGCRAGPAGFQNYLGERFDEASGRWEERYGKRAELTFGLTSTPRSRGAGRGSKKPSTPWPGPSCWGDRMGWTCGSSPAGPPCGMPSAGG